MSQNNSVPAQDAQFQKRRTQKNWVMLGLIMAGTALIWSVTMLKIEKGMELAQQNKAALEAQSPAESTGDKKDDQ